MADNPFDTKTAGLAGLLGSLSAVPQPEPENALWHGSGLLGWAKPAPPANALGLAGLFASPPPESPANPFSSLGIGAVAALSNATSPLTSPFGMLASFVSPPTPSPFTPPPPPPSGSLADLFSTPTNALYAPPKPKPVAPEVKRKAFFSFYYKDIMRVNNVRNAWKIVHPDSTSNRSFYDSSLWESRQLLNDDALKNLIRGGVLYTSAVCVLTGTETWDRRWVRYEIARAIVDGRGLLTVHLNNINHHQTKAAHPRGHNPLSFMGVAKLQRNALRPAQYFLYEKKLVPDGRGGPMEQWRPYGDHMVAVKKPDWLTDPSVDHVMPLSANAAEYDYELEHGHRNIGSWIDAAAKQAGR
jgi:hypothetical protein